MLISARGMHSQADCVNLFEQAFFILRGVQISFHVALDMMIDDWGWLGLPKHLTSASFAPEFPPSRQRNNSRLGSAHLASLSPAPVVRTRAKST